MVRAVVLAVVVCLGASGSRFAGETGANSPVRSQPGMVAAALAAPGGGGVADYYKIVRAQYVNLSGNLGNFDTTCFITNTRVQPITLKEVYVLGPGGTTTILATYTGLVGVVVPPLGQVRLAINTATIAGITAESSLTGSGVRSVVLGWHGPPDAASLTAVIERNDCCGNTYGRAMVSEIGVPLTL